MYLILAKFRYDWVKIVDFLIKGHFWSSPHWADQVCMWDQQNNYLNNIVRSELTVTFNYFSSIGSINTEVEEKYENN